MLSIIADTLRIASRQPRAHGYDHWRAPLHPRTQAERDRRDAQARLDRIASQNFR